MDAALAAAVPQLPDGAEGRLSVTNPAARPLEQRKRIRKSAIAFALLALGFYLGFIALTVYRSRL
jgi:hypothetical protein